MDPQMNPHETILTDMDSYGFDMDSIWIWYRLYTGKPRVNLG